jgi:hypothetical protein
MIVRPGHGSAVRGDIGNRLLLEITGAAEGSGPAKQGPERAVAYFLCGGVKNGDGVADVVFLSFLGFLISRLLFF